MFLKVKIPHARIKVMNVFIIASVSADGFIARFNDVDGSSTDWTSREDTRFFVRKTKEAGVIVMGYSTYKTIPEKFCPLKDRLNLVYTRKDLKSKLDNLRYVNSSPKELIDSLEKEGHKNIAICGGRSIYSMFMEAGVVDKLYLTVESIVFGKGVSLFDKELDIKLKLVKSENLSDQTILLEYDVIR